MFPDAEESQSIEMDPKMTQILELAYKDIKTVHAAVLYTFKKLAKDMEDTKKIQIKLLG